ncbi:MAG: phosphatidate cytidylyltransferase [Zoogloeaceae bacterium]|jgi:phosphatidate cytidylyltransferase|nr:phosphatidate cytidylyltransferase [Zoogloeaceae bacterium]
MLKQRIITAIVLLVGFLAALFYLPPLYWAGLMALVSAVAAGEWGGLAGLQPRGRLLFGGVMLICLVLSINSFPLKLIALSFHLHIVIEWLSYLLSAFWCLVVPFWLWRRWRLNLATWWGKGILLVLGGCLILATWSAFVGLREANPFSLLIVLGIAWVSDISAYFVGRKFGGRKLAPEISPGKTWAGVWGALVGVAIYGSVLFLASLMSGVIHYFVFGIFTFIFFAVLGIMGDLFESLLKRQAGIKDSSNILPGHGGVLDRIDSLMAILPCYNAVLSLFVMTLLWLDSYRF